MGKTALTLKQRRALKRAPPSARAAMAASFARQTGTPPAKPASRKPAPKARSRPANAVRSLLGTHYNAFHISPQPVARAVGHATVVHGHNRASPPQISNDATHQMVVFTMTPNRYCAVYGDRWGSSLTGNEWRGHPNGGNYFEIPNTGLATAGGPTTTMYGKFSVRLRNTTRTMDAGGSVYVLSLDTGCDLEDLTATYAPHTGWENLKEYVLGCPRTRVFSGAELLKTRQWNCHPVDAGRALQFHECDSTKHSKEQFRAEQVRPIFSQLVFLFAKAEVANAFEFSMSNQYYCRYEVGQPLANAATTVPTAPINVIDGARKLIEEVGSVGHVAQDVVGALSAFKTAF